MYQQKHFDFQRIHKIQLYCYLSFAMFRLQSEGLQELNELDFADWILRRLHAISEYKGGGLGVKYTNADNPPEVEIGRASCRERV